MNQEQKQGDKSWLKLSKDFCVVLDESIISVSFSYSYQRYHREDKDNFKGEVFKLNFGPCFAYHLEMKHFYPKNIQIKPEAKREKNTHNFCVYFKGIIMNEITS